MDTEWCMATRTRIVSDLSTYDGRHDVLDGCSTQLDCELVAMDIFGGLSSRAGMEKVLGIVWCMVEDGKNNEGTGYCAPVIHTTRGGGGGTSFEYSTQPGSLAYVGKPPFV